MTQCLFEMFLAVYTLHDTWQELYSVCVCFVCKWRCSDHCTTYCTRTALTRCFRRLFCCRHRRLAYLLRRWVACGLGSVHAVYASAYVQLVIIFNLIWSWCNVYLRCVLLYAVCMTHGKNCIQSVCSFSANHVARIIAGPARHALHSNVASVNSSASGILVLHIIFGGGSPAVSEASINVCQVRHPCKDDIDMIHSNWRH